MQAVGRENKKYQFERLAVLRSLNKTVRYLNQVRYEHDSKHFPSKVFTTVGFTSAHCKH